MKAAMRPIVGTPYESVFDRVVMDVIDVTPEIVLVADHVIPESPLSHTALAAFAT